MSTAPAPRLPLKAVVGLAISAALLLAAVGLEIYNYRKRYSVITEQLPVGIDEDLLTAVPPETPLPTVEDLTPKPTQSIPQLARPGMPAGHPGVPMPSPAQPTPSAPPTPAGEDPRVAAGRAAVIQHKCNTCHSLDGTPLISTSFRRLFGKQSKLVDGSSVTVDAAYIRESILDPNAKKVLGPSVPMQSYAGLISDAEIEAIVAFIESLK